MAVFNRDAHGQLTPAGEFSTGGAGDPVPQGTDPATDPLASQGALILDQGNQFLFAVNAGSNQISVVAIGANGQLTPASVSSSGGVNPVSLASTESRLYVVNAGDSSHAANVTGFQVTVQSEESESVPSGRVTHTDPAANANVKRGASVKMFVSTGPQNVQVPNVVGQPQNQATQTLQAAGFQVFVSQQGTNNAAENGRVLAQNPAAGQQVPKGSGVTLTVGRFP